MKHNSKMSVNFLGSIGNQFALELSLFTAKSTDLMIALDSLPDVI